MAMKSSDRHIPESIDPLCEPRDIGIESDRIGDRSRGSFLPYRYEHIHSSKKVVGHPWRLTTLTAINQWR